ncbi:MAG: protein translocase subunit SecF [Acidobacteriota bacterium]|nr:protein translocase subunit SecF [Acidobacteriota bacterium]
MRIIGETNFEFMGQRHFWLAVSAVVVVAAISVVATRGVSQGVEFTGGAQVILRYSVPPELSDVRSRLADAGLQGVSVTTSELQAGAGPGATEVPVGGQDLIIRLALEEGAEAQSGGDLTTRVMLALRPQDVREQLASGRVDLNVTDQFSIAGLLSSAGEPLETAQRDAETVIRWRRTHGGVFSGREALDQVEGLTDEARQILSERTIVGPFGLRGQEMIAASVSSEMRSKAQWAIFGALAGMLLYIWIRFQFQWGLAAIVALVHDTLITLGAFSLAGMEANLPVVAAFLTLVGYSVNDTIVVFDRVRENLQSRGEGMLQQVIDLSINQNLSRTLITSLTTWLVVLSLFLLGGPVIRPFAFVLLIGILVGTYSSIFIASPVLLIWQQLRGRAKKGPAKSGRRGGKDEPGRGGGKGTRKPARAER